MCFQTLRPTVTAVRNVIDKSLAERDANIDKMCTHIDKDIVSLGKEVKEVKQKAQVKWQYNALIFFLPCILCFTHECQTCGSIIITFDVERTHF